MKERKKATELCIKNNTSVTKSNKQIDESIRMRRSMSRISNIVQIQNVERLQFSHVLIPYLNGYIKAVTFGLVFIYSTSIICSICPKETLHMCRFI